MDTQLLGRTGLRPTIAGLGCGGHSILGLKTHGPEHSAALVREAFDQGVNFFDTATAYGTEGAVGQGLCGIPREAYLLSTKFPYGGDDWRREGPARLRAILEESLRLLRTDYIDVYHLHGVAPQDYPDVRDILLPEMIRAREAGKIRFLGITEGFGSDTDHKMLRQALPEDLFDVIMVGYNLLNPSAARTVLPLAMQNNVGVLCMFAVRSALSNPVQLEVDIGRILARGQGGPGLTASPVALDFLKAPGVAATVMEAAYRFARHTPGIGVTLTGTGNPQHLRDNLRSIQGPALPGEVLEKLAALFGNVDCISGQ